ncbi:sugar ABC transporter permease [Cohnella faecalis]|uniref:Sugar ABC transporter permease n=1 Tax=Cohnella faecalis TaxID=2315694 RepID=A0A398CF02_9BACL|nr:sugar ABC transporter permease [Cohnella faecalis]RIE01150.1 sugar ABC transporter permease [Cohnella faecalis]
MTNGRPLNSTTTMVLHIYNLTFQRFKMWNAAAVTVVFARKSSIELSGLLRYTFLIRQKQIVRGIAFSGMK